MARAWAKPLAISLLPTVTGAPGKRLRVNMAAARARTVECMTVKSSVSSLMPTFFATDRNPWGCRNSTGCGDGALNVFCICTSLSSGGDYSISENTRSEYVHLPEGEFGSQLFRSAFIALEAGQRAITVQIKTSSKAARPRYTGRLAR